MSLRNMPARSPGGGESVVGPGAQPLLPSGLLEPERVAAR